MIAGCLLAADCARLVLLGNGHCSVGLRRMMALAAPVLWDNLACSRLRRVAQTGCGLLVWYNIGR